VERIADLKQGVPCPICGCDQTFPHFHVAFPIRSMDGRVAWPIESVPPVSHWTFARCGDCGVVFPDPMPTHDEVAAFYAKAEEPNDWEVKHYVDETPRRVRHWDGFAEKLTRLNGGPGRMLEVGPAAGHLLRGAINQGWQVLGVEAAPKFSKVLEARGLPVHHGEIATLGPSEAFDMVVMIDVAEHLIDPVRDFARSAARLGPGGRIVVATCDIGSFAARYYGLEWRQLVPSHTFYWTNDSLRIALKRAGFAVTDVGSFRWWDPSKLARRRLWLSEFAKFVARKGLQKTWMPVLSHSCAARETQRRMTRGRLSHEHLEHKVGTQAVMSEVTLVVGQIAPR
jgi:SAM-dependent methyltransferase